MVPETLEERTRPRRSDDLTGRSWRVTLTTLAWVGIVASILLVCEPLRHDLDKWGGHDWDATLAFRQFVVKCLRVYHQFPAWIPYAGGGYTAWGFVDSDTIVVSPWLPFYLFLDPRIAARIEVVGMAFASAAGTWLLASRFTRSIGARAFACAVFVVNGRWALQATAGHAWHLYFAWMPWALYFFDRSLGLGDVRRRPASWRSAVASGAFVALMVYHGAIYPLPYTLLAIAVYGVLVAIAYSTVRPLAMGSLVGASSVGLAAPRLFPLLFAFDAAPRHVDSNETMDLRVFLEALTNRQQDFGSRPANPSQWGWHEWGMYIGWVPLVVLAVAAVRARGRRERAMCWTGLLFTILAFGNFHEYSPWHELHKLPVFRSLHVPSRWLYPAALLLAIVAAAWLGTLGRRLVRGAKVAEGMLVAAAMAINLDIASVAQTPMHHAFWMQMHPDLRPVAAEFHQEARVPPSLAYVHGDWSIAALPSVIANVGVVESTAIGAIGIYEKDASGKIPGVGAKGRGDPAYRGEVYSLGGTGRATVESWTPNVVRVRVEGASVGDWLILNQNFDRGWSSDAGPVENHENVIAVRLSREAETVTFRYWPYRMNLGLGVSFLTLAAIVARAIWERRRREPARRSVETSLAA